MSSTRTVRTAFAAAHNEFDLHLQMTFGGEHAAKGWIESIDVRLLTVEQPWFRDGDTGGILDNATRWGHDGFVSNPAGRLVTAGLQTRP